MNDDALEPLFSQQAIAGRIRELSREIARDFGDNRPVLIGVLKGSFIFLSDLVRDLGMDADIDFAQVSSYGSGQVSSGSCVLKKDISLEISGRHVLIVDDIVDTGLTLTFLKCRIEERRPASVKICCLIDKRVNRAQAIEIDYAAFAIQDGFVVGCGLDFDEKYRGLPGIYRLADPCGNTAS